MGPGSRDCEPTAIIKELNVEVDREVNDALRLWVVFLVHWQVIRLFLNNAKK